MADKEEAGVNLSTLSGYLIAGLVGLGFVSYNTMASNTASNTANLPATNANVAANAQAIIDSREQSTEARTKLEEVLRAEINRRDNEQTEYSNILDNKKRQRVDKLEARIQLMERMIFDHVNTPPAGHAKEK